MNRSSPQALVWFRQDLRLTDNQALSAACDWAREGETGAAEGSTKVRALYIATPMQWRAHDVAPIQLDFIERHLNLLAQGLARLGIALELVHLDSFGQVDDFLAAYVREHGIGRIFAGAEPEFNERMRDRRLMAAGLPLQLSDEHCLLPPGTVLNLGGEMYKVFTPFAKCWRQLASRGAIAPLPIPSPMGPALAAPEPLHLRCDKLSSHLWPAGEDEAGLLLHAFVEQRLQDYGAERDFPALDGTSRLSPYLAIGVLSPRQCVAALQGRFPAALVEDTPAKVWLNELIWREFYRHLLVAFPRLSRGGNFNPRADKLPWRNDRADFAAWCEGRTGYPLVDAAMRQLRQTGWMHNRLRMLVASFLTKHLLIDWRWGEQYFRRHLIDGDLAANNGGWQWSAGIGCDAQPYFRIFNPMTQSEKFDPDASFIRKYLPELAPWSLKQLHHPEQHGSDEMLAPLSDRTATCYPRPIIAHAVARARALDVLGMLKK
ncbi:deoxyribodipyrimidine photo-lyase [Shewanella salipaludis]|uniref:Deoxyribodipyrimidine photo-lyase n=1 Tax=Shewanella salipaludis TaxID=2723052 RepID=A0A972FTX5_9GAMM|nr:deoxyribodipyrimidine photo-lyase [Shewanella salipaludis]NMH65696.1 deoxyribodipyrimidine photo-lyase [Shewanella salipaludis]